MKKTSTSKQKKNNWINLSIEEYKSLRMECVEALKIQQMTLKFGTAIAGAIVVSGFNVWDKTFLPDLIFLIFIPLVSYLVLVIWIGEVSRMMRAGYYLSLIEKQLLNGVSSKKLFGYEIWLRVKDKKNRTPQLKWNYVAIIFLFCFISLSSILIGNYKIWDKTILFSYLLWINIAELIALGLTLLYLYIETRKFK